MVKKIVDEVLAARDETFRKAGESMWETPAGVHAIRLLAKQESITVDDIVASLESELEKNPGLKSMYDEVILKLRDLQERQRAG